MGGHAVILEGHCTRARSAASVYSSALRAVLCAPLALARFTHSPTIDPFTHGRHVHFVIHWLPAPPLRSCLVDALPSRKTSADHDGHPLSPVLVHAIRWGPSCKNAAARGLGRRVVLPQPDRTPFRRASLSCTASRDAPTPTPAFCVSTTRPCSLLPTSSRSHHHHHPTHRPDALSCLPRCRVAAGIHSCLGCSASCPRCHRCLPCWLRCSTWLVHIRPNFVPLLCCRVCSRCPMYPLGPSCPVPTPWRFPSMTSLPSMTHHLPPSDVCTSTT